MTRDEIVRVIDNYTNISAQRSLREGEKYQLGLHRLALRGLDLEARVRELEEENRRLLIVECKVPGGCDGKRNDGIKTRLK